MSCKKNKYTAEFFKKEKKVGEDGKVLAALNSSTFNSEDKIIAKLYRKVVDDMYEHHKLTESRVNHAIINYKENLNIAHRRGFRRFQGINFNKPINRCSYLRRYAVPYTGLVKKAMSDFFKETRAKCVAVKKDILQSEFLNVISLGGGPGNDLVGFCSAIYEKPNGISKLVLKVIDRCSGWSNVFSAVAEKAKKEKLGSFSNLLKSVDVTTGFVCEDLTLKETFKDKNFASNMREADVILMVKFLSFLQEQHWLPLLSNVAKIMSEGSTLVYIDCCQAHGLFKDIRSLKNVYNTHLEYQIDFDPKRFQSKTVAQVKAYVHVFRKVAVRSRSVTNAICALRKNRPDLDIAESAVIGDEKDCPDTLTEDDTSSDESCDIDESADDTDDEDGSDGDASYREDDGSENVED